MSVTRDEHVRKGISRPIQPLEQRMEMLRALRCVQAVAACRNSLDALEQWNPKVYAKGFDRRGKLLPAELKWCREHGVEIYHTKPSELSTTKLIARIKCA